ncbi:hypothetical protein KBD61_03220 [Patescibacteria group bacterium]|nr:hypothetical protein [Patescibacteria group bacterium]MBP9710007.1 hypothetical protein [Patescibacteria group bacterium]
MEARPKSSRSSVRRRPVKAVMAAASSPVMDPKTMFNTCGHDSCSPSACNVRYVGPVSHMRDHHALHAARGVTHVWTAAIVSGLAVVLTGVLAYSAAQAQTRRAPTATAPQTADTRLLMERLDRLEVMVREVAQRCVSMEDMPMEERAQGGTGRAVKPTPVTQ